MDKLNALVLFGKELSWSLDEALFWLMIAQILMIVVLVVVFVVLTHRVAKAEGKQEPVPETVEQPQEKEEEVVEPEVIRTLVGISIGTDDVKKEFDIKEDITCVGLKVIAHYITKPQQTNVGMSEADITDKTNEGTNEAVTTDETTKIKSNLIDKEVDDYEYLVPEITEAGTYNVKVMFYGFEADYEINIIKTETSEDVATVEQIADIPSSLEIPQDGRPENEIVPIILNEESQKAGTLRYDRSFTARLIQSDDDIKHWYTLLKNELLSYKKIKDRMSWKRESYRFGREVVAKISYRGKTLCLFLPLDPNEYIDTKYKVEDTSENSSYADTPCMYRIKNDRRVKYAIELIEKVMEKFGCVRVERESIDYYLPYEGVVELIDKGLIKRNIKTSAEESIFNSGKKDSEA